MLAWSVLIATTTRVTVGEFERGTADLMLTLPVSRIQICFSTSLVCVLIATLVSFTPLLGIWIATLIFETKEAVQMDRFVAPACNFFCLNIAVAGLASLAGCVLNRRGLAISIVISIVFVSLVINFVEPFVDAMSSWKLLSLLSYYRPVDVVREQQWPIANMITLTLIGLISWIAGLLIYRYRDVPTA